MQDTIFIHITEGSTNQKCVCRLDLHLICHDYLHPQKRWLKSHFCIIFSSSINEDNAFSSDSINEKTSYSAYQIRFYALRFCLVKKDNREKVYPKITIKGGDAPCIRWVAIMHVVMCWILLIFQKCNFLFALYDLIPILGILSRF